jgi:hypothetical protein
MVKRTNITQPKKKKTNMTNIIKAKRVICDVNKLMDQFVTLIN